MLPWLFEDATVEMPDEVVEISSSISASCVLRRLLLDKDTNQVSLIAKCGNAGRLSFMQLSCFYNTLMSLSSQWVVIFWLLVESFLMVEYLLSR